jgi:hypothetical protein
LGDYYKMYMESHEGDEGEFFCEVVDGLIVRHVSVFNRVYYWATREDSFDGEYDFTSRPEFDPAAERAKPVPAEAFEATWSLAIRQPRGGVARDRCEA